MPRRTRACPSATWSVRHARAGLFLLSTKRQYLDEVPDHLREAPLDRGERDTLVSATVLGSNLILMDETEGRR